jgi:hypothetical protein
LYPDFGDDSSWIGYGKKYNFQYQFHKMSSRLPWRGKNQVFTSQNIMIRAAENNTFA